VREMNRGGWYHWTMKVDPLGSFYHGMRDAAARMARMTWIVQIRHSGDSFPKGVSTFERECCSHHGLRYDDCYCLWIHAKLTEDSPS